MSTFDTPHPITAIVEIVAGTVRLVASERDDTLTRHGTTGAPRSG